MNFKNINFSLYIWILIFSILGIIIGVIFPLFNLFILPVLLILGIGIFSTVTYFSKNTEKKAKIKKFSLVLTLIFLLLISFSFTFQIYRPFMGEITEDRPFMEFLCNLQFNCGSGKGPYSCAIDDIKYNKELKKWKGYNGCTNSTKGFYEKEGHKYIVVKSCGCGGLM
jgi:hypothetical protein